MTRPPNDPGIEWIPNMRSFSVVIPAYNEAAVIGRCIERLFEQQELDELEIVEIPN